MSQERQYLDLFYTAPSILVKHLHPYSIAPEEAYLIVQVFTDLFETSSKSRKLYTQKDVFV